MNKRLFLIIVLAVHCNAIADEIVTITVDASAPGDRLRHVWSWYGTDECNYVAAEGGRQLMRTLAQINREPVYIRSHCLLNTGDGTPSLKWGSTNAYTEDTGGNAVYDWRIMDQLMDAVVDNRCYPLVEIGFMPRALSTHPAVYDRAYPFKLSAEMVQTPEPGWAFPPTDYLKWADLIRAWARHSAGRYGPRVKDWKWELWNEPNIFYWKGSFEEYCKLFDYTENALHDVLPDAVFGGPHVAGPDTNWLRRFLEHCTEGANHVTGAKGTRLDYVGFHSKGRTRFVDGHAQTDLGENLRNCRNGFATVARFAACKNTPIIIGECDPEGMAARSSTVEPANGYRNGCAYAAYEVALMKHNLDLAARHGVNLQGVLTWAFLFEGKDYFEGFRTLSTNGIRKAVCQAFEMLGRLDGDRVALTSTGALGVDAILERNVREKPDIDGMAVTSDRTTQIILWNYHDDVAPAPAASITLRVRKPDGEYGRAEITHWRIDETHSNPHGVWLALGSPRKPTDAQLKELHAAATLQQLESPCTRAIAPQEPLTLTFDLPRFGVSLLEIAWHN